MSIAIQEVRKTLYLAWPIMVGLLGQHLFGLIDTIMVGRHSTVELAAASFVNNVCSPALVFLYGFSSSISVRISQARGQNDPGQIGPILKHGLLWLLVLTALFITGLFAMKSNLPALGQTPEVTAHSYNYLSSMTWSLLPLALFMALRQFSDGLEKTLLPTVMVSIGFLLNTFLNWLLIFGNWGFPEMGLAGAGYATFASRSAMLLAFAVSIRTGGFYRPFVQGFRRFKLEISLFRSLAYIGGPSAIQYLFEVGVFAGAAIAMGWLGTNTLAAHQVVLNLATITFMLPLSLSIATSVRVGHATGRKNWAEVSRITWSSIQLASLLMSGCGLLFLFGRHWIPSWFTTDQEVIAIAGQIFIIAAIFQIFDGAQSILVGALRGANDVRVPTAITFVAYWVVGASLALGLAFPLELRHHGIWSGLALSLIVAAIALGIRFRMVINDRLKKQKAESLSLQPLIHDPVGELEPPH